MYTFHQASLSMCHANGHQSPKLRCLQIITGCSCLHLSCTDSVSSSLYLNTSSGCSIGCRRSCVGFVWRTLQTSDSLRLVICETHPFVKHICSSITSPPHLPIPPATPKRFLLHNRMCCSFYVCGFLKLQITYGAKCACWLHCCPILNKQNSVARHGPSLED